MDTLVRTRGFTLIEVLIVLLVMGMFVGLASALVRPDDRQLLRIEAERLGQLMLLVTTESLVTGKTMAWTSDGSGYNFWQLTADGEWREVQNNVLLRQRTLPQGMLITDLKIENTSVHDPMRLAFYSNGPTPSFTITLFFGSAHYRVAMSPVGEIQVLPGREDFNEQLAQ